MFFLEFSALSFDISIIRHRVAAEIDAFFKRSPYCRMDFWEFFYRDIFHTLERIDADAPEYLV
jgi:hypothetical protein